ncbi:MAG TPA: hypothetical protein VHV83_19675 [Armatimonadota bacterium]|nr:hypothetical protein [Armatimonadota bacterium]
MGKNIDIEALQQLSESNDKFRAFEREVIGGIQREAESRKGKLEAARISREKKAKRKRQRAAANA